MGSIRSYPFTKVLVVGANDEVPEFDDDTMVIVEPDSHPLRGETMAFDYWISWETDLLGWVNGAGSSIPDNGPSPYGNGWAGRGYPS